VTVAADVAVAALVSRITGAGGLNGLAYDGGRLIWVRNHGVDYPYDMHVAAIDPATGATIWNNNLHAGYGAGAY
jgi:hypothetical protein